MGVELQPRAFSTDTLEYRHANLGQPVQHCAVDFGFGLLGRERPGTKAAADNGLVAEHGGFRVRSPAVADCLLPPYAFLGVDHLDVLVALGGVVPSSGLGTAVARGGITTATGGLGWRSATAR